MTDYGAVSPRIYAVPGVANMRDLGGYPAKNGGKTAMGRFIRSTALAGLGQNGEQTLLELGIGCVIDLRSVRERQMAPDAVENSGAIRYAHIPMLDHISSNFSMGDFTNFPKSMTEMYVGLLEQSGKDFAEVFKLFADERPGGFLFHCTAGKDRTGVTAMLLLGLAGVPQEIIVGDYAITRSLLGSSPIDPGAVNLPRYLFESNPDTMREILAYTGERFGGVEGYLESIGVNEDTRLRVLNKLLES